MRLTRLSLTVLLVGTPLVPAMAQLRASRPPKPVTNNPRLLVANPYSFSPGDSAPAIRVGSGLREKLTDDADRWFSVITRQQMNEALLKYAYPADAMLPPLVARTLATALQARTMISGTIAKGEGGRFTFVARLAGLNDDAGQVVTMSQKPNQSFEDFGGQVADAMIPAMKALEDAKACMDQQKTKPDKAAEAARKALQNLPNHGLSEYCLGELALAQKKSDDALTHFRNATKGDSLSLKAWNQQAVIYQQKHDSSKTIETYKQMLRVAPTNQALREEALKLFLGYGQPEAAIEVAKEGLSIDPNNTDLLDLMSNACLYKGDNKCAIDALEQVYAIDSTKADSTFFIKMTFAASKQPDTTRFLKWAKLGVMRHGPTPTLLGQLTQAYAFAGPMDSLVATTMRLMAVDTASVDVVIKTVKALQEGKRIKEAIPFKEYVLKYGADQDKQNYGILLAQGALPLLQPPQDLVGAAEVARISVPLLPVGQRAAQLANYVLGMSAFFQAVALDKDATEQKSCEIAKRMQTFMEEAAPALTIGKPIAAESVDKLLTGVEQYKPRLAQMQKAYCK